MASFPNPESIPHRSPSLNPPRRRVTGQATASRPSPLRRSLSQATAGLRRSTRFPSLSHFLSDHGDLRDDDEAETPAVITAVEENDNEAEKPVASTAVDGDDNTMSNINRKLLRTGSAASPAVENSAGDQHAAVEHDEGLGIKMGRLARVDEWRENITSPSQESIRGRARTRGPRDPVSRHISSNHRIQSSRSGDLGEPASPLLPYRNDQVVSSLSSTRGINPSDFSPSPFSSSRNRPTQILPASNRDLDTAESNFTLSPLASSRKYSFGSDETALAPSPLPSSRNHNSMPTESTFTPPLQALSRNHYFNPAEGPVDTSPKASSRNQGFNPAEGTLDSSPLAPSQNSNPTERPIALPTLSPSRNELTPSPLSNRSRNFNPESAFAPSPLSPSDSRNSTPTDGDLTPTPANLRRSSNVGRNQMTAPLSLSRNRKGQPSGDLTFSASPLGGNRHSNSSAQGRRTPATLALVGKNQNDGGQDLVPAPFLSPGQMIPRELLALVPAPLLAGGRNVSLGGRASMAAPTVAHLQNLVQTLEAQLPPEYAGKSSSELNDMLMDEMIQGQADSLMRPANAEVEKEKPKKKKKKKKPKKKKKKVQVGEVFDEEVGEEEEEAQDVDVDVVGEPTSAIYSDNTRPTDAASTTTPVTTSHSASSPTPTPPQPRQLGSPSPFNTSAFSSFSHPAPPRTIQSTPLRNQATPRTARKPVETSPQKEVAEGPTSFKPFAVVSPSGRPKPAIPAPAAYGERVYSVDGDPFIVRIQHTRSHKAPRGSLYYFDDEREAILEAVQHREGTVKCTKRDDCRTCKCCNHRAGCSECRHRHFAYVEIKTMPTTITPEERKRIIDGNRSLRTIKTELENLSENGLISNDCLDLIMQNLPSETSLNTSSRPTPSSTPVVGATRNVSVTEAPPAYHTPTAPTLPTRQSTRPEIGRVVALYPYAVQGDDAGDCTFIVQDEIAVYEHVNADWWMGKNLRTQKEGVFPSNYVIAKAQGPAFTPYSAQAQGNEKAQSYGGYQGQPQYQQSQPGPSNPYNSDVPPQAVANQPSAPSKGAEHGKKFGKKLGNAAIFGAGASIGSGIVRAIF